jgi:hypothetical protein
MDLELESPLSELEKFFCVGEPTPEPVQIHDISTQTEKETPRRKRTRKVFEGLESPLIPDDKLTTVYMITNLLTGKAKVGFTREKASRFWAKCKCPSTAIDRKSDLLTDIQFFGKSNFQFDVIDEVSPYKANFAVAIVTSELHRLGKALYE